MYTCRQCGFFQTFDQGGCPNCGHNTGDWEWNDDNMLGPLAVGCAVASLLLLVTAIAIGYFVSKLF